jgi:Putative auto-transporter adhesin, head GIN domain
MKKTISLMAVMLCSVSVQAQNIERKVDMGAFTSVGIAGSTDAEITVGPAQSILLRGPKGLVDNIEVVLKDGALLIKHKKSYWATGVSYKDNAKAIITVPALTKVAVSGSGDITVAGLKATDFGVAVSGSGDITASGSCTSLRSSVSGSGDIDASGLKCASATTSISGSGDSKIFASESATVSIAGSGDVRLEGVPKTSCAITIAGSGDVSVPGGAGKCTSKIAGSGEVTY